MPKNAATRIAFRAEDPVRRRADTGRVALEAGRGDVRRGEVSSSRGLTARSTYLWAWRADYNGAGPIHLGRNDNGGFAAGERLPVGLGLQGEETGVGPAVREQLGVRPDF